MQDVLQLLAVLALVVTALAVMVGALSPGDAFRRLGTALVLLLVVPALIQTLIRSVLATLFSGVTEVGDAAAILGIIAVVALIVWLLLRRANGRRSRNQDGGDS